MCPEASIVISTHNRAEELSRAIASARTQSADVEILVMDDASTDETQRMVSESFPEVRYVRSPERLGYIEQRNRGARLAAAPIIFSLDDDACFSQRDVVEHTLREFNGPQVGAIAIPLYDVNLGRRRQVPPSSDRLYVTDAFVGTAHALRRELFLQLGGYRPCFVHQGEEQDYCLRMMARGAFVALGTAAAIHHFESPNRDRSRLEYFDRRNAVLFTVFNVPFPEVVVHAAGVGINTVRLIGARGSASTRLRGLRDGCMFSRKALAGRAPVARNVYRLNRRLKKHGPLPLSQVAPELRQHVAASSTASPA